ncbi:glycine--tRNA ligase [Candidatus Woesearchaeota archaeon]|nr:glycine--tRNA ligase [Candidatus Woesearchaeota archaeon]
MNKHRVMTLTIDEMAAFCKRKAIVFPSCEIYGSMSGFFDLGPYGVEIANNIKQSWWKFFVLDREDVVGIDGSAVNSKILWEASGHVQNFADIMVHCTKCKEKYRADVLVEDVLKLHTEGMNAEQLDAQIRKNNIKCTKCDSVLGAAAPFNMMFETYAGIKSPESLCYLRPETAQLIFANFRLVYDSARMKLPFGIAQIGKAFRNEIAPRNFLFRAREFEQMEIEYFIHPDMESECPCINEVIHDTLNIFSEAHQKNSAKPESMSVKEILLKKVMLPWHAYWMCMMLRWFTSLGAKSERFRCRQHVKEELSHYAKDTWDLEYEFPFGWKELQGMANRRDFDLKQHMQFSGKDLCLFDEKKKEKFIPYVVCEPSQGVGRAMLVFLFDAYEYDHKRENVVLKLSPKLAPFKAAVFPLLSNRPELVEKARQVFDSLKASLRVFFDDSGSIGRRYARQDEIGTPFCITVDFQTLQDGTVTVRNRDSTVQERILAIDLKSKLLKGLV